MSFNFNETKMCSFLYLSRIPRLKVEKKIDRTIGEQQAKAQHTFLIEKCQI